MSDREPSGRDRLSRKSEDWVDRQAGNLADRPIRTGLGWAAKLAILILVVGLFFSGIGFVAGWFNAGKDIVSPANVKEQNYQVREGWNSLVAGADNACQAQNASTGGSGDPTLIESPALAYAATYRRTWVEYNRRMDNAFEAKVVRQLGLGAYPRHVPDFREAHGRKPNWCAVSDKLAAMGPA